MTEILTESFCERCGTRYTFETARPRHSRLGRARTFTKGVRNFVLSDDPFSVAMAEARGEEERNATAVQLDAFHKTFNFCLSCRQYTCSTCWNVEEGRCLSCAPRPGSELVEVAEPEDAAVAARLAALAEPEAPVHESIGIASWPQADLAQRPAPEAAETATVETGATAALAAEIESGHEPENLAVADVEVAPEPQAAEAPSLAVEAVAPGANASVAAPEVPIAAAHAADAEPLALEAVAEAPVAEPVLPPEPEAAAELGLAPAGIETTSGPEVGAGAVRATGIHGLRPGESLDEAIAAYEAALEESTATDATERQPRASLDVEPVESEAAAPAAIEAVAELPERVEAVAALAPLPSEPVGAAEPEAPLEEAAAEAVAAGEPEAVAAVPAAEPEPAEAVAAAAEQEPVEAVAEASAPAVEFAVAEPEPPAAETVAAEPLAAEPQPEPQPLAAAPEPLAAAPEPLAAEPQPEPQPEPIAATVAPEPEPVAAASSPAPVPMAPGWLTVAPDDGTAPVWPQQVNWSADRQPSSDRTFAGRRMLPTGNAASVWAASAREVLEAGPLAGPGNVNTAAAAPGAQPCVGCGLPLSANARFCRRCGARQTA